MGLWGWITGRKPNYYVDEVKQGGRGQWWIGIYDAETGDRVFQTAPPGHATERDMLIAVKRLEHGVKGLKK